MVSRAHELKIVNTVCPVTIRRQQDTLEAAGEVDLMVVVGGRSSANTKELTRLCEIAGTAAIQIESVHDLTDPAPFASARDRRRHRRHLDADRGPARRHRADPRDGRHARGAARRPPSWPTPRSTAPPRRPAARPRSRRRPGSPTRSPRPAPPDPWRSGTRRAPGRRHRRPTERRQEHALQPVPRPAHGDRRGPRPDDPRPPVRRHRVERPALRHRRHRRARARPRRPDRGARPGAGPPGDRRGRRHPVRGRRDDRH